MLRGRHTVRMGPRRIAGIAAVLGGAGWVLSSALTGSDESGGHGGPLFYGGLVLLALALAAAGYALVEKAPVWLRLVVATAVPLLVLMIWQLLDQALAASFTELLGGALAVALGLWALVSGPRRGARVRPAPVRGRRAAR